MYTLQVESAFEAAHQLPGYPGKCARLHGHSWVVEATVKGKELDKLGMLIDFKLVKAALEDVLDEFDHQYLNELEPFKSNLAPTAENLAKFIFDRLAEHQIFQQGSQLAAVRVWESPKSSVTYTRD